jgi:cation-transporting ATPase 13A1
VRIYPRAHKGEGELAKINRVKREGLPEEVSFTYQADKYILTQPDPKAAVTAVHSSPLVSVPTFRRLPFPADARPLLGSFKGSRGLASQQDVTLAEGTYGKNHFDIPMPTFMELFAEHAVAPFFVFQIFCVGLWMLDEYWYYSLFTLFMLVVFECTVVFQVSAVRWRASLVSHAPRSACARSASSEPCPSSRSRSRCTARAPGRRSARRTSCRAMSSR